MEPWEADERENFLGKVVFTNGHLRDRDALRVYYGASDIAICRATISVQAILDSLNACTEPGRAAGGRGRRWQQSS